MPPVLLLAILLNASGAPADPDLVAAERAWAEGRTQEVLPLLERAQARPLTASERVRAWELEAFTHLAFDAQPQAITAFRHALGIDAAYRPPPRSSPKVLDAFKRARAQGALLPLVPPSDRGNGRPTPVADQRAGADTRPGPNAGVPLLRSPWFWTGVGVVAAGSAAAFLLTRPTVQEGNLGRFELR